MNQLLLLSVLSLLGCEEAVMVHAEHAGLDDHDEDHDHDHHHEAIPYVPPERAARVLLTESNELRQATEALGIVDAHEASGHHEEALAELRARAAALGADAVLGMEFHHGAGHGDRLHLSGMAVRYRELLRDEPYYVVGELDVVADMDHQERAIAEMQRRGGQLRADLIIKINYRHGDGSEPVHLIGTAIRYRSSDRF
jgi:uncharacterized protein YbjQ (UPF0145 family)